MGAKSSITWTEATWNPQVGCNKVSEGCKNCYMHRILDNQNLDGSKVEFRALELYKPYQWLYPKTIFVCSMSDFFIPEADSWRDKMWEVIKNTPHHTYLILTKRPERIKGCLPEDWCSSNYSHVWLGVTVENQETIHRIHTLGEIPCKLRWVSFEPLLSEIYLTSKELSVIDWAILGGESGSESGKYKYRKTELSWFLSLMYQLRDSKIPLFFKQFGTWYHENRLFLKDNKGEKYCSKFPNGFRIRETPIKTNLKSNLS